MSLPSRSAIKYIADDLLMRVPIPLHKQLSFQSFGVGDATGDLELCWRLHSDPRLAVRAYTLYDPLPANEPANGESQTVEQRIELLAKHGGARDFLLRSIGTPFRRIVSDTVAAITSVMPDQAPLASLFHHSLHRVLKDDFTSVFGRMIGPAAPPVTYVVGNSASKFYKSFDVIARSSEMQNAVAAGKLVVKIHTEPFVLAPGDFTADFAEQSLSLLGRTDSWRSVEPELVAPFADAARRRLAATGELHLSDDLIITFERPPAFQLILQRLQQQRV
jgi:hypothetical protein